MHKAGEFVSASISILQEVAVEVIVDISGYPFLAIYANGTSHPSENIC